MAIGSSYIQSEEFIIAEAIEGVSERARQSALSDLSIQTTQSNLESVSDALTQSETSSSNYIMGEIVAQTERDIMQVIRMYSKASIKAQMIKDSMNISHQDAVMRVNIDRIGKADRVWFTDRGGRLIPAQRHVKRVWRMIMRDQHIATYNMTMTEFGQSEVAIWHPDVKHRSYGQTVKLDGTSPSMDDYAEVFHPNSSAVTMSWEKFERMRNVHNA